MISCTRRDFRAANGYMFCCLSASATWQICGSCGSSSGNDKKLHLNIHRSQSDLPDIALPWDSALSWIVAGLVEDQTGRLAGQVCRYWVAGPGHVYHRGASLGIYPSLENAVGWGQPRRVVGRDYPQPIACLGYLLYYKHSGWWAVQDWKEQQERSRKGNVSKHVALAGLVCSETGDVNTQVPINLVLTRIYFIYAHEKKADQKKDSTIVVVLISAGSFQWASFGS